LDFQSETFFNFQFLLLFNPFSLKNFSTRFYFQQDLDEQECVLGVYDCTEGFLTLARELFRHKTRPGAAKVAPYLRFLTDSIIRQFSQRTYADGTQMVLFLAHLFF
jgi:hypothetical protein